MQSQQSINIKKAIIECLQEGITDKQAIYGDVSEKMDVPRPTVRRVARSLRDEFRREIAKLTALIEEAENAAGDPAGDTGDTKDAVVGTPAAAQQSGDDSGQ